MLTASCRDQVTPDMASASFFPFTNDMILLVNTFSSSFDFPEIEHSQIIKILHPRASIDLRFSLSLRIFILILLNQYEELALGRWDIWQP